MIKGLIIAVSMLWVSVGCSTDKEPVVAPGVAKLIGTWQLTDQTPSYAVTLNFTVDPNNPPADVTPFKASGESSVNTYNGLISAAADGMMVVYVLGSTKKAGPPEAMQFEQKYLTSLKAVVRYELTSQNQLRLHYGGETPGVLLYNKIN